MRIKQEVAHALSSVNELELKAQGLCEVIYLINHKRGGGTQVSPLFFAENLEMCQIYCNFAIKIMNVVHHGH